MYRPEIVIRDIHRYGEDLTVPEAIARLHGGGQVTVTVTDPAPPGGDPRGNPRNGSGITVSPAEGGSQPGQPPHIAWPANRLRRPRQRRPVRRDAHPWPGQLAACAGPAGGQSALSRAVPTGSARGPDAARRALARAAPEDCRDITARLDAGDPITGYLPGVPPLSGVLDLASCFGVSLAAGRVLAEVEAAFFNAGDESLLAEAGRIARDRAAQDPGTSSQRGEA